MVLLDGVPKPPLQIPLLPIQHLIHRIRPTPMIQVLIPPRNNVRVYMRDTLPRVRAVLNRNVETGASVNPFHHPAHASRGEEQVAGFRGCEVRDPGDAAPRTHEDVAWEDGF